MCDAYWAMLQLDLKICAEPRRRTWRIVVETIK
jgi:hypothetical protein